MLLSRRPSILGTLDPYAFSGVTSTAQSPVAPEVTVLRQRQAAEQPPPVAVARPDEPVFDERRRKALKWAALAAAGLGAGVSLATGRMTPFAALAGGVAEGAAREGNEMDALYAEQMTDYRDAIADANRREEEARLRLWEQEQRRRDELDQLEAQIVGRRQDELSRRDFEVAQYGREQADTDRRAQERREFEQADREDEQAFRLRYLGEQQRGQQRLASMRQRSEGGPTTRGRAFAEQEMQEIEATLEDPGLTPEQRRILRARRTSLAEEYDFAPTSATQGSAMTWRPDPVRLPFQNLPPVGRAWGSSNLQALYQRYPTLDALEDALRAGEIDNATANQLLDDFEY